MIHKKHPERIIKFSGFEWVIRDSYPSREGPGNNLFSSSKKNVWIDTEGRLHLKITHDRGKWYCSGIRLKKPLGYGTYTFYVDSDVSKIDVNVVAGMFTYLNDREEIDIEFSKWSDESSYNAQYVVQPADVVGNKHQFDVASGVKPSIHSFEWRENFIFFESLGVKDGDDTVLSKWKYTGDYIPKVNNEKLEINLWLYKGLPPSDLKEVEIILNSVSFSP
ncbi:glycoside hydrolase family 16 protein [Sphingobacterium bovistauri]|uniref:Glycoside hydrolase family 16 protein n=1 Tax=Sphingobacterium bovistauri TaxID=2781959 RepID=A0ABS7Z6H4_9SPHI|nr:glycoside hydrolase family 16 protein [Sphingobacterium bovistauri]MCA5005790.1 glycoside hydrolase family 16 protein [Sphingobacterium bovistauri]